MASHQDLINRALAREVVKAARKHIVLSDEDYKLIQEHVDPKEIGRALVELGGPYTAHELRVMHQNCDEPYTKGMWEKADKWRDDVLDGYMEHIRNYYYKYKPEATEVDPSIDPSEEQVGPMAQDIEKVNPAAVKETEEGVKTVDTGRLALMNAGAIASLARKIDGQVPSDTGIKTGPESVEKQSGAYRGDYATKEQLDEIERRKKEAEQKDQNMALFKVNPRGGQISTDVSQRTRPNPKQTGKNEVSSVTMKDIHQATENKQCPIEDPHAFDSNLLVRIINARRGYATTLKGVHR